MMASEGSTPFALFYRDKRIGEPKPSELDARCQSFQAGLISDLPVADEEGGRGVATCRPFGPDSARDGQHAGGGRPVQSGAGRIAAPRVRQRRQKVSRLADIGTDGIGATQRKLPLFPAAFNLGCRESNPVHIALKAQVVVLR